MHTIRTATLDDVPYLASHLRKADIDELRAVGWTNTTDPLVESQEISIERWCALDAAGNPAVLFGVAPSGHAGIGLPWMVATDYIYSVPKETLRQTRRYVHRMHEHFTTLTQFVDFRNVTSVTWMQWLGFKINMVLPHYGVERRPFINFIRKQEQHHV